MITLNLPAMQRFLNYLKLAAGYCADSPRLAVELFHVNCQVFGVVGGKGALLTLDLLAQMFGVHVARDILRHFRGELTVPARKSFHWKLNHADRKRVKSVFFIL